MASDLSEAADTTDSGQTVTETAPASNDSDPEATASSNGIDPETLDYITERLAAIDTELTALRNDEGRSEADLRALIRDEIETVLESNT